MSLIIGIKCKEGVVLGYDSAVILSEDRKEILECASNAKVWVPRISDLSVPALTGPEYVPPKKHPNMLIGSVGTVRDANVVRSGLCCPYILNMEVIITTMVPDIRNILIQNGFISDTKPYQSMDSSFVVVSNSRLFTIGYDYSVIESKEIIVAGYCENEAKNVIIQMTKDQKLESMSFKEAEAIITEVMTICAKHCTSVDLPIHFSYLTK